MLSLSKEGLRQSQIKPKVKALFAHTFIFTKLEGGIRVKKLNGRFEQDIELPQDYDNEDSGEKEDI